METSVEFSRGLALPSPVREHQREGVRFLFRSKGALLADELGLGKAVQVSVVLRLLARAGIIHRALIVVPVPLLMNWRRELEKWAPELSVRVIMGRSQDRRVPSMLPASFLLVAYDSVRNNVLGPSLNERFDLVLLDQAKRIENASSQTALACRLLPRTGSRAIAAAPVGNSADDLASVFSFVRPVFEFLVADIVEGRVAAVLSEKQSFFQKLVEEADGSFISSLSAGEPLRILEPAPFEFHTSFTVQQH